MRISLTATTLVLAALAACVSLADDPPKVAEPGTLLVIDASGTKTHKLKAWKFTLGTRHLAWLAPAAPPDKEPDPKEKDKDGKEARPVPKPPKPVKPVAGPEALEFRDENSTTFVKGVTTLIPLDRLRGIDYDPEKDTVSVRVATGDKADDEQTLTGTTKFKGINKLAIEAEVDKGELGVAEVKFLGGVPKGIRGVRFAPGKVTAAPAGRPAVVTIVDKDKKTPTPVTDLQVLYSVGDGAEKLSGLLMFKKTLKIDVAKIKKISPAEGEGNDVSWNVTLKDGGEDTLALLQTITLDGKEAVLEGLLGKVPAGYKLFPVHTIGEVEFDVKEKEPTDK
jgi:hypothetical protein